MFSRPDLPWTWQGARFLQLELWLFLPQRGCLGQMSEIFCAFRLADDIGCRGRGGASVFCIGGYLLRPTIVDAFFGSRFEEMRSNQISRD